MRRHCSWQTAPLVTMSSACDWPASRQQQPHTPRTQTNVRAPQSISAVAAQWHASSRKRRLFRSEKSCAPCVAGIARRRREDYYAGTPSRWPRVHAFPWIPIMLIQSSAATFNSHMHALLTAHRTTSARLSHHDMHEFALVKCPAGPLREARRTCPACAHRAYMNAWDAEIPE